MRLLTIILFIIVANGFADFSYVCPSSEWMIKKSVAGEHFYVKNPTPKDIGNMSLEDKARLEVIQENEIRSDKYKLKYRVIGDHMPSNSAVRND
jgi:hypothetical protein